MSAADFFVRVATPDDARAVSDVLAASYSTLYRGWYRDDVLRLALPAMSRARPALLASGTYFVASRAGSIVSCGGWSRNNPSGGTDEARGHIRHFGTHPDHLNRGCASAILRRCLDEARAAGLAETECLSSLTAEAFYAGHGFNPVTASSVTIGGTPFACVLMRRAI